MAGCWVAGLLRGWLGRVWCRFGLGGTGFSSGPPWLIKQPPGMACPACRRELVLVDWGVSNATLEEVFIRITRDAGVRMTSFA